jgi:hypothetical protein
VTLTAHGFGEPSELASRRRVIPAKVAKGIDKALTLQATGFWKSVGTFTFTENTIRG